MSPHCLMTHVCFQMIQEDKGISQIEVNVVKHSKKRAKIECCALKDQTVLARLTVQLLVRKIHPIKFSPSKVEGREVYRFSKEEIYDFSKRIHDENPIHLNEEPIVQGLLLLQFIYAYLKHPNQLQLKFVNPVFANDAIYIKEEASFITGYTESGICFKGNYEKKGD